MLGVVRSRGVVSSSRQARLDALVRRLDLDAAGADQYRGVPGSGTGRAFGGMLLAQGLIAAGRTVDGATPHSVHAHFLRPARRSVETRWTVERLRDGLGFISRRVQAEQGTTVLFVLTASFVTRGSGFEHQDAMPSVPAPEQCPDVEDLRARILGDPSVRQPDGPLEIRECDPEGAVPVVGRPGRRARWMRPRGVLPDDGLVHAAVLAFASDRGLLSTAGQPHGLMWGQGIGASLDHALWLHRPVRFDDWLLFTSESPVAVASRGMIFGALYTRAGARVASVAQEGLIRLRER
jgi:acyl-CoA thioesterase-2